MISIVSRCLTASAIRADAACLVKALLDCFSVPVVVVQPDRTLVHANAAGKRFLDDGMALKLQSGVLHVAGDALALVQFEDAIRAATPGAPEVPASATVVLPGFGGQPVLARVMPLRADTLYNDVGGPLAAIFFPAPQEAVDEIARHIKAGLNFTPCEARVAAHVAIGRSPRDIAARLNLSVNTIRSHLARIYSKTGCSDQTAVCSLINGMVLPLAAAQ